MSSKYSIENTIPKYKCHSFISILQKKKLSVASSVIAASLLLGTQQYKAQSTDKDENVSTNQEVVSSPNLVRSRANRTAETPISKWLPTMVGGETIFAGGNTCASATTVNAATFTDTGNTTGSVNDISNYFNTDLPFPYPGPDQFYKITIGVGGGTIASSMPLTGSTLDGATFLMNACPPTSAANSLGNSQDAIGPGAGPENMAAVTVPAGTYFIAVDSYYGSGSASAGPYSITITTTNLVVPVAAGSTVKGRVVSASGRGIGRVQVAATLSTGETISKLTNSFGYFSFDDIQSGETVIFSVSSKRHQFGNPTQVITVNENIDGLTFTALP